MNANLTSTSCDNEKRMSETNVQTIAQNLTSIQGMQNVQAVTQSNIQNIQPTQTIVGSIGTPATILGKSVSLMKPIISPGTSATIENSKITTTLCPVGSTVRIISPSMLNTVERPNSSPSQISQSAQQVTSIPATYHVPRGAAAVANISAPRSAVATPIVRANMGQPIPTTRAGINTTISNPQWQTKTTPVMYQQSQRHQTPSIGRVNTKSQTTVFSSQQPRLISPATQGRPLQATMVTGVSGTASRLITPVLQTNSNITRLPVSQSRPSTPQITNLTQVAQPGRISAQTIQPNRPLSNTSTVNRVTVSTSVVGSASRISGATSVSVQPTVGRQLAVNTTPVQPTGTVSRIVLPPQQPQPQGTQRVVQTVTSLSNLSTVSRVIATTSNTTNISRLQQPTTTTTVTRITGMSLHPVPSTPTRVSTTSVKTVQAQNIGQTIQIKQPAQSTSIRTSAPNTSNTNTSVNQPTVQPVQGQYLHPPHTTTYYSFDTPGTYPQFKQSSVQPVRLLVEPNYEEPHGKPNASPRPSILRKRDHDGSPAKGAAKNLVPVLASLSSNVPSISPPCSPRGEQDTGGCQSSGSTTVSATSSPGLDEDPEQSRITINPTVEMSPRKKPRKQQLTGVELTESRCTQEEIQFITEEKLRKDIKEDGKDKLSERRHTSVLHRDIKSPLRIAPTSVRMRPMPSLLGASWKNRWGGRLHHYRRPSDVRPREERRPTVAELANQQQILQKLNGWKVYHLTAQMEDIADLEKQVHEKLKTTLVFLETQQTIKGRPDDGLERVNELIKGNLQRSNLISEGMNEARAQLVTIFEHKTTIKEILQRCGNKRAQKKRDK